jgi:hypothetical protein
MAHVALLGIVAVHYALRPTLTSHLFSPGLLKLSGNYQDFNCMQESYVVTVAGHGLSSMCALCACYSVSYTVSCDDETEQHLTVKVTGQLISALHVA